MIKIKKILFNILLLTFSLAHGETPITNHIKKTQNLDIEALIETYVDKITGVAVAIVDQDKTQFFTYGKQSILDNQAVSENTIFEIGSITKVFTTLLLMEMLEKKELDLDAPIERYLSHLKIPTFHGQKISIRHLATHHSGLPCIPNNFHPKDSMNPYEDYKVYDLYQFLSHYDLERPPGEQFEYSNLGMGLLGHLLAQQTPYSYEELVINSICNEIGMDNTRITLTPEMEKLFATGYHHQQEVKHWDISSLAGCGALRSNIKDMAQFLRANMGLIDSPLTELLQKCQIQQFSLGSNGIGLGWIILPSNNGNIIWHNGGTGGFRAFLGFNPETQKGVVILSNSTEDFPDELALRLIDPDNY